MISKKLRVTILGLNYAPEPTGNAPYTTSLAEGLAAAGHQVRVITGYPHYPEWKLKDGYSGWQRQESTGGVDVVRLRHYIPGRPSAPKRMLMELSFGARLLFSKWGHPDVVLVVSPALFACAMAMARIRLTRRPPATAVWVQDLYGRGLSETGTASSRFAHLLSTVESMILQSADGVVAIHERFREHIVNSLGIRPEAVKVIRNWTHLPPSPNFDRIEFREMLGWAPDDIIALHAGNMGRKQGLENVVRAAKLAGGRTSRVRFVLMGNGNQRNKLQSMSSGVDNINFLDPLPDEMFLRALAAADVLLVNELPELRDMAVPSKLTSYFNAGVPVIAATGSDSVTASELYASGGGHRVDAANPEALLLAVEDLVADSATARSLVLNGLRFRHETLSEAAAVEHYNEFITNLASSRGR